jgi:hypothetical protein
MGGQIGNTKVKSKFRSKIEVGKNTGRRCLMVHYRPEKNDFNEVILRALAHHGIKRGQITTIAIPER